MKDIGLTNSVQRELREQFVAACKAEDNPAALKLPDFAAFRAVVKKALKADIPLAERSDWEDWIARDKAEIARLTAEIKANEERINSIVYELFELTDDEIRLLETT